MNQTASLGAMKAIFRREPAEEAWGRQWQRCLWDRSLRRAGAEPPRDRHRSVVISVIPEGALCRKLRTELFFAPTPVLLPSAGQGVRDAAGAPGCAPGEITASAPKPSRQGAEKQAQAQALHWDNYCPRKEILTVVRAWA